MNFTVKISRLIDKPDSNIKAIANVTLEDMFVVRGIKVVNGEKGLFLTMPSSSFVNKSNEKKYNDIFYPITKSAREALHSAVMNEYMKLQQIQQTTYEVENKPDEVPTDGGMSDEDGDEEPDEDLEPEMSM